MLRKITFALLALAASSQAQAINKCIGADGKIVFQDAPCPGRGESITVRPASGNATPTTSTTPANTASAVPVASTAKKEGAFGAEWQRRTYLENRGVRDARATLDAHVRECAAKQAALAAKKSRSANNLAGATWEQSISTEMQAAATICDGRARDLRANLESLEKELRELQSK